MRGDLAFLVVVVLFVAPLVQGCPEEEQGDPCPELEFLHDQGKSCEGHRGTSCYFGMRECPDSTPPRMSHASCYCGGDGDPPHWTCYLPDC